ncbi:hybrid sensor histidine kinase/response regulator transcription factor [Abyssalbus ytuae]|uniref:histidine kinase n=1 Tax=Abyssalbus ytuae TaxID=2926907 RepID=A0A9E6ZIB3_9FLAO|nr:hybrid sensor histidine kinase/response regulator transcription factor [Abyssalbus ytuae]UOB16034.1 response regulator [Abyssalbus ytuae]
MKKAIITFFVFQLLVNSIKGQEYYFKHFKVENGLSHNTINKTIQDKKGFLWFGTKNGLNRFDGYTFKVFQNNPDDPKSLKGYHIESLHEFNDNIWVGTNNGLYKYNEKYENFDLLDETANSMISDIENDADGNLWYITGNILYKYSSLTKKVINYRPDLFFYAQKLLKSDDNNIWVSSTNQELFKYSKENNSFKRYIINFNEGKLPFRINTLFFLNKNTILIGTHNHGVIAYNIESETTYKFLPPTKEPLYVRDIIKKDENELWIATESGIYIYNLITHELKNLKKNYNNPYAISDNAVYCLTIDKEGGVWAGTYFGGINYSPKQYSQFKKYFPKPGENSISGNAVREIHPDRYGNLWIGTEDAGLNKLNLKTGIFTNYTSTGGPKKLSHYNIHALLPVKNKVWIGNFNHGLDVMDINTGNIIKHYDVTDKKSSLSNNFVLAIYQTRSGEIYLATASGIQIYNKKEDNFLIVDAFPENFFYTSFFEDIDGTLWAGTTQGLYFYNPFTNKKGFFKHDSKNLNSISNNRINIIFQDSKNNIWVATENGLNLYNKEKNTFKKYSTKEGFPSNVFYAIVEDNENKLWITTTNGLVEFQPELNKIKTYTKSNGLLSDQYNYNSAYKDPNGEIYFGSVDGMISFNPSEFNTNSNKPTILLTGLQVNNKEVSINKENSPLNESITTLNKIKLKHNQSSFSIDFASLSFTAPELTEYWYKLDGLNKDWTYLKTNNRVFFTELAPGNYTFKVKSLNSNGVWSHESPKLKIEVQPPFFGSKVAYILYFIIIGALIFLILRYYHLQTERKNIEKIKLANDKKEKEIYHAKIEFFTNVSHEIKTPLTLIKSPLEKILKKADHYPELTQNLSIMEKNTSRLLDLVNQLLDFRKTEMESLNLTFVKTNISNLIRKTFSRFSEAINDKEINFTLNLGEADLYAYVDEEAVKKILSNLFNNAIKYAKKQIEVILISNKKTLEIYIKNDGNLIPSHLKDRIFEPFYRISENNNTSGTGIGLSLAHSLTEQHKGTLKLDTSFANLNVFVLELPIHQDKKIDLYNFNKPVVQNSDIKPSENIEEEEKEEYKPSILLVEDNLDLLDFVGKELMESYHVIKVTSAENAIEILAKENENIQLIVSDVMMSGMDGFALCKHIKTNIEYSHVPVILVTAKNNLNAKIEGLESGAEAYIEKPFSIEFLKIQITNLINNRKHIMEHYTSSPLAHIRSIASTKTDKTFINKLDNTISEHLSDTDFGVDTLCDIMNMSRSTLYRKIKEMSNLSPNELINISRLKKAAELLSKGDYKIYEVSEMIGYNSQTSFGRNFLKQFKMTPTEYMNSKS